MPVTLVNTAQAENSGSNITISVPAGTVNGDVMLLEVSEVYFFKSVPPPMTFPSWTVLYTQQSTSAALQVIRSYLFYRIASSEPASYTFAATPQYTAGQIMTFTGALAPDVKSTTATATTSSITTLAANSLLVHFYAGLGNPTDWPISLDGALSGMTQQGAGTSGNKFLQIRGGTIVQASIGASSVYTATNGVSTTNYWRSFLVSIPPSGGGGGGGSVSRRRKFMRIKSKRANGKM